MTSHQHTNTCRFHAMNRPLWADTSTEAAAEFVLQGRLKSTFHWTLCMSTHSFKMCRMLGKIYQIMSERSTFVTNLKNHTHTLNVSAWCSSMSAMTFGNPGRISQALHNCRGSFTLIGPVQDSDSLQGLYQHTLRVLEHSPLVHFFHKVVRKPLISIGAISTLVSYLRIGLPRRISF